MSKIIDGRSISTAVKARVAKGVLDLKERGIDVGLAVIIVGNNPASKVYVANKKKACEELGIISEEYALPESTTEEQLLELIAELNGKKSINGILCQLPLPSHIDEKRVIDSISPEKDVDDGFFGDIIGKCPLCEGNVVRTRFGYGCDRYKDGCRVFVFE